MAVNDPFTSQVVGTLLGCMCGDVLGAAVGKWTAEKILDRHPAGLKSFTEPDRRPGFGCYTDDTQMTMALTRSIVQVRKCDADDCAAEYAVEFQKIRRYGASTVQILELIKTGEKKAKDTGRLFNPEGSNRNGGAMRISPVGLAYRNAPHHVLKSAVEAALLCTHVHKVAVDAAFVQAAAVGWLANKTASDPSCTPAALLQHLLLLAETESMKSRLLWLQATLCLPHCPALTQQAPYGSSQGGEECLQDWEQYLKSDTWCWELSAARTVSPKYQAEASETVACALLAFLLHWHCPEDAIIAAVHYGGDTDTMAAMAGALAGALHGDAWLPGRWLENLENGTEEAAEGQGIRGGRDALVKLAHQLALVDCRT